MVGSGVSEGTALVGAGLLVVGCGASVSAPKFVVGALRPATGQMTPTSHAIGADVPPGQYEPTSHKTPATEATLGQYCVGGHGVHLGAPVGLYEPDGHATATATPSAQ